MLFEKIIENLQPICCVVSSKFTVFFLQSYCSRILLFLVPFINQLSVDPFVAKNPKPLLAEKLSRTIYLDPLVSEKLKNQLICKIINAALGPFGEVSFFGHSVRFIKMWTKVCYETSYSTKVSFFFIFFSTGNFFVVGTKNKKLWAICSSSSFQVAVAGKKNEKLHTVL